MRPPRWITVSACAVLVGAALTVSVGCGEDAGVTGSVRVGGSSTLLSFVQEAAAEFSVDHPLARTDVAMTGTGDGIALLCDAISGVAAASRPATVSERRDCARSGVPVVPLLVGRDVVVVFTARDSRAPTCLDLSTLAAVTGPQGRGVRTWSAAGLPLVPLAVVVPESGSGTRDTFVEKVIAPAAALSGGASGIRSDAVARPLNQLMLAAVLGTPGAIGIAGLQTADPWRDRVRLIAIDGGDGCIIPSEASVSNGNYPLSRDLFLYISGDAEGSHGEATIAFGDLVSSPGFLERVGQGLSAADIAATTRSWAGRRTGDTP